MWIEQSKRMIKKELAKLAAADRGANESYTSLYGVPFTKEELEVLALNLDDIKRAYARRRKKSK
jgi:hypothetical protein